MTVLTPENKLDNILPQDKQEIAINESPDTNKPDEMETQEDPNWKVVRQNLKKAKADREAAEKRANEANAQAEALKAAMEAAFAKQSTYSNNNQQNYQENQEETEDERIEKKVQAAIAKREIESEKLRAQREQEELPNKLRRSFADYDSVVNEENGAYLAHHHPEIYRSLTRQSETFETCSDIYHVVKKLIPNFSNAKKDSAKADNNFNKPKSMSSTGFTQTQDNVTQSRLSEDKKRANWERMQKLLKGVSN
jgi:multidrug efflux pump subunit AcrA (membrane-fusion protein)